MFIDNARVAGSLALKITNYIGALEILFITSNIKVKENLATRVSMLLESYQMKRDLLKHKIREAYKVRSEYIHGSKPPDKREERLTETVKFIDDVCRRILVLLIENDKFKNLYNMEKIELNQLFKK